MSDERSTHGPGTDPSPAPALGLPKPKEGPRSHERCPHCGTVAVIERSSSLRWVCGVCGKARAPIDDAAIDRRFEEKDALAEATHLRNVARTWLAMSWAGFGFGALSLLFVTLATLVAKPGGVATVLAYLVALTPAALGLFARKTGTEREKKVPVLLEQGFAAAAHDVVRAKGKGTAREVAEVMRVDEAFADRLLARLSVEKDLRTRVSDEDAQLTFDAGAGEKVRVRADDDDEAVAAEAEAEAAKNATSAKNKASS